MQGSGEWRVNNLIGQDVHTKPPYPGVGVCAVRLGQCPIPVSANQVSMSPVVAPGRDAALMEFDEGSSDFFFERGSAGVGAFPGVRWASSLVGSYASDLSRGEGREVEVKSSQAEVCGVVPPLVVWEELFNASEAYFADGFSSTGTVQEGEGEVSGRVVEPSDVGVAGECGPVGSAGLSTSAWVLWVFAGLGAWFGVALLSVLFGW